jgi:ethanolamine utilization protein EutM
MSGESLGMIETRGFVAAVEALDAGMKAANVHSEGYRVTPSGLVMISFRGDVAAVKTAVSAGVVAAHKVGEVVSHHVIPRPDTQLEFKRLRSGRLPLSIEPSGAPRSETKQSEGFKGSGAEQDATADPASRPEPSIKSKRTKRSAVKPSSSTRKVSAKREKKQAQRGGKKNR